MGGLEKLLAGILSLRQTCRLQGKRVFPILVAANLGLLMRSLFGFGTPRGWAEAPCALISAFILCVLLLFRTLFQQKGRHSDEICAAA